MVPYTKWRKEYRDVCVGDVVEIYDSTSNKIGSYKLGIVDNVKRDSDEHVLHVLIKYKIPNSTQNCYKYIERAIQNLVIIIHVEEMN